MLLILDVDGVLTDGKKYYDHTGKGVLKTFCDRDFTAIKKFKANGWNVIFLSGDRNVNEAVAKNRKIPFYHSRQDDKMVEKCRFLPGLCKEYDVSIDDVVYVGDDIFDYELLAQAGWAFCPSNADPYIKSISRVLDAKGGDCCVSEVFEYFLSIKLVEEPTISELIELDNNEKF